MSSRKQFSHVLNVILAVTKTSPAKGKDIKWVRMEFSSWFQDLKKIFSI